MKKAWPEADLWIVHDAGHSAGETGIVDGLVKATDKLADGDKPLYLFAKVTFTGKSMAYKLTKGNDVPKGAKPALRANVGKKMRDTKDGVYKCTYM